MDAGASYAKDGRRNPTKRRAGPASFSLDIRPSTQEYKVCKWLGDTQCLEGGAFNHRQRCRSSRREALWHCYAVPQPCSVRCDKRLLILSRRGDHIRPGCITGYPETIPLCLQSLACGNFLARRSDLVELF